MEKNLEIVQIRGYLAASECLDAPLPFASIRFFNFLIRMFLVVCVTGPAGNPCSTSFLRNSESLRLSKDILTAGLKTHNQNKRKKFREKSVLVHLLQVSRAKICSLRLSHTKLEKALLTLALF